MRARWFAGKHRSITRIELVDAMPVPATSDGSLCGSRLATTASRQRRVMLVPRQTRRA